MSEQLYKVRIAYKQEANDAQGQLSGSTMWTTLESISDWLEQHGKADDLVMVYDNEQAISLTFSNLNTALMLKLALG